MKRHSMGGVGLQSPSLQDRLVKVAGIHRLDWGQIGPYWRPRPHPHNLDIRPPDLHWTPGGKSLPHTQDFS